MLYTQGNMLLVGTIIPARELGMLLASDKISKAVVSVSGPITQTLFPEVCALRCEAPQTARRYLRLSFFWSGLMGFTAAIALWGLAPWIILIALGPGYADTVPLLRVLCFVIPFLVCNFVLGTQILVPFGQEKALVRVLMGIGIVSLPIVALVATFMGVRGAAYMPVCVEGSIFCLLSFCVYRYCPEALFTQGGR
ncbi:MAG: polysaccharide biosynthesis C-terminal domain-containing protein [Desulfovibrionaceae bacterium]